MKDIDFDELDRAVSSVLAGAAPKQDVSTSATPTLVGVGGVDADGVVDTPMTSLKDGGVNTSTSVSRTSGSVADSNEQQPKAPGSVTPLAIKRRGKFMDVVHPSSDMNPTPQSVLTPSRKTLSPLSTPSLDERKLEAVDSADLSQDNTDPVTSSTVTAPDYPVEAKNVVSESAEPEHTPETESVSVTGLSSGLGSQADDSEEPMNDTLDEPNSLSMEPSVATDVSPISQSEEITTGSIETPFLTDAKVEKRPLGGFGETAVPSEGDTETTQTSQTVTLPRELQPDIVSVEAIHDDTKAPVESLTTTAPTLATVPAGENEEGTHSLFDTSSYHEPITHAKKSSIPAWVWWLLGLIACLAAGAGVGYFLFVAGL